MMHRPQRVADAIRDAVAEVVTSELADPGLGFVTITRCRMSRDLKIATVYLSVMGDDKHREAALKALDRARGYIRHRLRQHVQLRYVPELQFRHDDLLDHEWRMGSIIDDLFPDKPRAASDLDEPDPDA